MPRFRIILRNPVSIGGGLRSAALCLIALYFFLLSFKTGFELGMPEIYESRYGLAIPSVISERYGSPPCTIYASIYRYFSKPFEEIDFSAYDDAIDNTLHLQNVDKSTVIHSFADDKGSFLVVKLAFLTFGCRLTSIYFFYFFLLLISSICFAIQFFHHRGELLVLPLFFIGFYTTLLCLPLNIGVGSPAATRSFGMAGLLPVFHLAFLLIRNTRPSPFALGGALFQAILLALVVYVRASDAWELMALFLIWIGGFLFFRKKQSPSDSPGEKSSVLSTLWQAAWAPLLVLGAFLGMAVYKNAILDDTFKKYDIPGHVIWHTMLQGYGADKDIDKEYGCGQSDTGAIAAVKNFLLQGPDRKRYHATFEEGPIGFGFATNHVLYEAAARELFFTIAKKYPLKTLKLFLLTKPASIGTSYLWAMGRLPSEQTQHAFSKENNPYPFPGDGKTHFFRPLSPLPIVSFVLILFFAGTPPRVLCRLYAILAASFLFSLLPGYLANGSFAYIPISFILFEMQGLLLLAGVGWALAQLLLRYGMRVAASPAPSVFP